MHDFKYCIWLVPNKDHSWINIPNDFTPHMTVKSHLDKKDANYIYNKIKKENYQLKVKLVGKLFQDSIEDFYALEYSVQPINDNVPEWFPKDAHISFAYQYKPFTNYQIKEIENKIKDKNGVLDLLVINKCSGDFKNWKKIEDF